LGAALPPPQSSGQQNLTNIEQIQTAIQGTLAIDLKGSTHHLGSLKVLTSGNEGGPAAVGA